MNAAGSIIASGVGVNAATIVGNVKAKPMIVVASAMEYHSTRGLSGCRKNDQMIRMKKIRNCKIDSVMTAQYPA